MNSNDIIFTLLGCIAAYLVGSIPFGLLLGKIAGVGDIRQIGSGNIGATNMLRTGKKGLAALTLFLDFFKGILGVAMAQGVFNQLYFVHAGDFVISAPSIMCYAGVAVVMGHVFPIWLKFKGGKGVATTLGVLIAIEPLIGLMTIIGWIMFFYLTRVSSLAALGSISAAPILGYMYADTTVDHHANITFALMAAALTAVVIYRHKDNIARLRAGTEEKWEKKMTRPDSWTGLRGCLAKEPTVDVLRLIRSENVGPVTFFNLIRQFGSAKNALDAIPSLASKGGKRNPVLCYTVKDAEREIEQAEKIGARMLRFGEEAYPPLLMHIYDPPPLLTVLGFPHIWQKRHVLAVVGSRNASANGYQLAKKLAAEAGAHGVAIASGLARGIDTAAHAGSLATGTVAVMASGIDHIYPPENKALYESIAKQGAIVTEQPFGMAPHSRSFPGRNRIISGMSQGVVVEASLKSGSLITARFALDQDREVFAVPGSPLDPRCKGTNGLIKQGAVLCESIEDVMTVLNREPPLFMGERRSEDFVTPQNVATREDELAEARKLVRSKLGYAPVLVDELLAQCQLTPNLLSLVLLELELAGNLIRHTGHKVSLRAEEELLLSTQ